MRTSWSWLFAIGLVGCASTGDPGIGVTPTSPDGGPLRGADGPQTVPTGRPEVCDNGLDDDGNGDADDTCPCTPGTQQSCYLGPTTQADVGICRRGSQTCEVSGEFGLWTPCIGTMGPAAEVCDMIDNDCNGVVDDGSGACAPPVMPPPVMPPPVTPPPVMPPPAACNAPIDLTPRFAGGSRSATGTTCGAADIGTLLCTRTTGAPDAFFTWAAPNEEYSVVWNVTPGFEVGLAQADSPCAPGVFDCEYIDASDYAHPHTLMVEKADGTCGDFTITVTREY